MRILKQALPIHLLLGIVLAGVLATSVLATPAASQERRGRIEIHGVVTALDVHNRRFHVQALRGRFAGYTWAVVVDRRTDFELRRRDRDRYDDDDDRRVRRIAVGDLVAVEGRLIAQGTILAREVEVFRRGGIGAPPYGAPPYGAPPYGAPPYGAPPYGVPPYGAPPGYALPAPVISYPTNGSFVGRNEFIISGRTVRQARVHIKVAPVMGPVAMQPYGFQTDADYSGFFSAHVTPARLLTNRGMQYQITVVAESQGVHSPATTLIVHTQ